MDLLTLFSAFAYGLSSSLSLCLASCLPFYMPILFGYGQDRRGGIVLSLGFAAGRFAGYLSLGAVAAWMGAEFIGFFSGTFPAVSSWIVFVFGILTVFYGILILAKAKVGFLSEGRCRTYIDKAGGAGNPILGTLALGFVSTITPCVPVFTFLLLPFALGKIWETAMVTVAFGLGANMAFVAIGFAIGLGMENVKERFNSAKRPLEVFSAAALMVFGTFYALWASGPLLFGWSNASYTLPSVYDFTDFLGYLLRIP
ncbi:MAG: sulfite exporter TauE/SafE family protein [Candidatus Altiarchaeota archaeon]